MEFIYNDGGRSNYFKAERVGDCVTRAIANATGLDYKKVYDDLNELAKSERTGKRKRGKSSSRDGVYKGTYRKYLELLGWEWVPTMSIGTGCRTHLCSSELPKGTLIVRLSKHLTCVKDGIIYDTYDCSRGGTRGVYGYWRQGDMAEKFDQMKYINEFNKLNYKHYHIKVNLKDQDVIEQIEKQSSKNGYIVNLIKEDIRRNKKMKLMGINEFENSKYYDEFTKWLVNRDSTEYPTEEELKRYYLYHGLDQVICEEFFEAISTEEVNILKQNGLWEQSEFDE